MAEFKFKKGDLVEKFAGEYGGPGVVVCTDKDEGDNIFVGVSMKVEGGFGHFVHFFREKQLRHREKQLRHREDPKG